MSHVLQGSMTFSCLCPFFLEKAQLHSRTNVSDNFNALYKVITCGPGNNKGILWRWKRDFSTCSGFIVSAFLIRFSMLRCILILAVSSAHFCVHASHLEVKNSTRLVPFEFYEEVFFNLHQFFNQSSHIPISFRWVHSFKQIVKLFSMSRGIGNGRITVARAHCSFRAI